MTLRTPLAAARAHHGECSTGRLGDERASGAAPHESGFRRRYRGISASIRRGPAQVPAARSPRRHQYRRSPLRDRRPRAGSRRGRPSIRCLAAPLRGTRSRLQRSTASSCRRPPRPWPLRTGRHDPDGADHATGHVACATIWTSTDQRSRRRTRLDPWPRTSRLASWDCSSKARPLGPIVRRGVIRRSGATNRARVTASSNTCSAAS